MAGETKEQQVRRLCTDQVIHNVAARGITYFDDTMVKSLTEHDGLTPTKWFMDEAAWYYGKKRGEFSYSYPDAPALAVLRTRSAILGWRAARPR